MAFNVDNKKELDDSQTLGPMVREKQGTLGCILRLKRRISHRFGRMLSRETIILASDQENENVAVTMVLRNSYSNEFLDEVPVRNEPNGNIPTEMSTDTVNSDIGSCQNGDSRTPSKHEKMAESDDNYSPCNRKLEGVRRQWSDTDGGLLSESQVVTGQCDVHLRQRKPPRPKSECLLSSDYPKSYRFSAFRGTSPFGKTDTYVKLEQLGEGSYATVYKGISNLNNKLVALKEIRLLEEEGTPFTAIREASLLRELRHANVVTLHDIIHTKETLTFVFEFVNTDLSQYLEKHGGGLHPQNVKEFVRSSHCG